MGAGTVVVGASLAGLRAGEALRREGFDGALTLVGAEAHLPYDRPPLSKQVLTGKVDPAATALDLPDALDATWRLGAAASALDLDRSVVRLVDGDGVPFERLVIATGSSARTLPAADGLAGVHVLRTLEHAIALRAALTSGAPRVAVVGGGVIGMEVASSARTLGLDVTVLESATAPLLRLVGPQLAAACAGLHRDHGVDVRAGVTVDGLAASGGRVEGVVLAGGEAVPADVVVIGIGASPCTDWLRGSGVDIDDGVLCDSRLRVLAGGRALPHVVAAGDVARWRVPATAAAWAGGAGTLRIEHWTNAADQGAAAAATLLAGDGAPEFGPIPYVWSDQHGRKLQVFGLPGAGDEVVVTDGSPDERRFAAAYGRDGRVVAAAGMSRPPKVIALRAAIERGDAFPPPVSPGPPGSGAGLVQPSR